MKLARLNDHPEIFYSLQGEGASAGAPAVFVRLYGCNLGCGWCDTAYSWDSKTGGIVMPARELAEAISSYPCRRIVLTGGEPLMQQEGLPELLDLLPDHAIEVETNGTLAPSDYLADRVEQFNVSPKLGHAGVSPSAALRPDVLGHYATTLAARSWFKFVVSNEADIVVVNRLAEECNMDRNRVILMPLAADRQQLEAIRLHIAELAIKHGLRFSDRLHMTLWGDRKGV